MGNSCTIRSTETPQQEPSSAAVSSANEEFWIAGSVQAGDPKKGTPAKGPFIEERVASQQWKNKIVFSETAIENDLPADWKGPGSFTHVPIYGRAFFPHCLPAYPVGWAKLELSQEHPHYNCKKQREREKEKERLGVPIDHSRRKKYYIYPERVSELGLFLYVDNIKQESKVAVSNTSWSAELIPGAFFTFNPDPGSVFGEPSLPIPLRPADSDERLKDRRWLKLSIEFNRILSTLSEGSHEFKFDLRYRYGNTKFTAWRGTDSDRGVYRYSDEDRPEAQVSEVVATGGLRLVVSADTTKAAKEFIAQHEPVFREMETTEKAVSP